MAKWDLKKLHASNNKHERSKDMISNEDIKRFAERDEEMLKLEAENTIQPNNLFHTPQDIAELQAKIMNYTGSERAAAMLGAMMAWNLACSLVNKK